MTFCLCYGRCLGRKRRVHGWAGGQGRGPGGRKGSAAYSMLSESWPPRNAVWAWETPQLLPAEGVGGVAAAAKQVQRDNFLIVNTQFTGDSLRGTITTWCNMKSGELYDHQDLGSFYGYGL